MFSKILHPGGRHTRDIALCAALLCVLPRSAWCTESAGEREQLDLLLRQLDTLERSALHARDLPRPTSSRYRFDYARLLDDITRVRGGIQDYLTPQRAQPRDSAELDGDYTVETAGRSDTSCR